MAEEKELNDVASEATPESKADASAATPGATAATTPSEKPAESSRSREDADAGGSEAAASQEAGQARAGRRGARVPPVGIAHIKATFNNTIVSISDLRGNVISWSSAGKAGFKGSRKSTAFAATVVGQDAARAASAKGMHEVEVQIQGAGSGRESAVRAIQSSGLAISAIKDITPIPHNGCRQRKRRRV